MLIFINSSINSIINIKNKAAAAGADIRYQPTTHIESESSDFYESSATSDSEDEIETPSFTPGQCIFCETICDSFNESIVHMASTHSFIVPFQDSLTVDLETLIWYLHLVIYGYNECILCGKRRNGIQAVQQHMHSLGHCRFDVNEDISEFYDLKTLDRRIIDTELHLPSGRIATQRAQTVDNKSRQEKSRTRQPQPSLEASTDLPENALIQTTGKEVLGRKDRKLAVLSSHMGQLSVGDQAALAHLPASEQRSVLMTKKKQLDQARRAEYRSRIKLERKGNKILQASYRAQGPERPLG